MTIARLSPSGPKIALQGAEPLFDNGNSGAGTKLINWANGPAQKVTLTGNAALGLFQGLTPGEPTWVQLEVHQDATGNRVPTLPAVFVPGGTPLVFSTAAGATDILSLHWNGAALYGALAGLAFQ